MAVINAIIMDVPMDIEKEIKELREAFNKVMEKRKESGWYWYHIPPGPYKITFDGKLMAECNTLTECEAKIEYLKGLH